MLERHLKGGVICPEYVNGDGAGGVLALHALGNSVPVRQACSNTLEQLCLTWMQ